MKILLINQNWFQAELRAMGHEVASVSYHPGSNLLVKCGIISLDEVKRLCFGHREPDAIIVHDNSMPVLISGLERSSIPRLFYSVDVHHHHEIHASVGKAFDHILLAQKDYAHHFAGIPLTWFPLWASNYVEPAKTKEYGAVFVGTLNPKLNPDRVKFFAELEKKCAITVKTNCQWETVFPKAQIVVNQTVKGDLNFRVFEVMMSGACLLTEEGPNGLTELFTPGVHLVTYKKGDVEDAAQKIKWLLAHPEEAARIAKAGRDEIIARHTAASRAQVLEQILLKLTKRDRAGECYGLVSNYTTSALRIEQDAGACELALSAAMAALQEAIGRAEPLTEEVAAIILLLVAKYETYVCVGSIENVLTTLSSMYPNLMSPKLGLIRMYLNRGQQEKAYAIAAQIMPDDPTKVFGMSEKFLEQIARPWTTGAAQ